MVLILLAGLAAWIGTSIIVEAEIFRDVREAIDRLHDRKNNWWTYKLRYLIQCHMCTGIWVSGIIALFVPAIVSVPVVGWGITALAIKGVGHSFLILQKYFEAKTSEHNAQADLRKIDVERSEQWMKAERASAESADSLFVNSD